MLPTMKATTELRHCIVSINSTLQMPQGECCSIFNATLAQTPAAITAAAATGTAASAWCG
jgi:hypothetical protein